MAKHGGSGVISPTSARMQARIIDAVVDIVAAHGLSGTTLANVARAAGVSQGALVFHFDTKQGLLAQTLRRLTGEYLDRWQQALAEPDPLSRIIGLVRADFSHKICTPKTLSLWFAFWGEAASHPLYKTICEQAEDRRSRAMVAACHDLQAAYATPDPVLLAQAIDGMTDGLWLQMHINPATLTRQRALENAFDHMRLLLPDLAQRI